MKDFRISLAGDLGSGKSTVAKILVDKFNAKIISVGLIQREVASKMGLTIEEFNKYMETHPDIDRRLDSGVNEYNSKKGSYIFDSRLSWHFVPTAVSFYLKTDKEIAANRIYNANRSDESYKSVEDAINKINSRRESEIKRYKEFYGLNILDMSNYDCVIDTTYLTPDEVAKIIESKWKMLCDTKY